MGGSSGSSEGGEGFGRIERGSAPDTAAVVFERGFAAPVADLWLALVDHDRLAGWLNRDMLVEPHAGGRVHFAFGAGDECEGEVIAAESPRHLRYVWRFPGGLRMELDWALQPGDSVALAQPPRLAPTASTVVTLRHDLVPADRGTTFAAGWHAHFDQLDALLRGAPYDVDTRRTDFWGPRVSELHPVYEALSAE